MSHKRHRLRPELTALSVEFSVAVWFKCLQDSVRPFMYRIQIMGPFVPVRGTIWDICFEVSELRSEDVQGDRTTGYDQERC